MGDENDSFYCVQTVPAELQLCVLSLESDGVALCTFRRKRSEIVSRLYGAAFDLHSLHPVSYTHLCGAGNSDVRAAGIRPVGGGGLLHSELN